MKHLGPIGIGLALLLAGLGCKRDCDNLRPGFYIPLTAETAAWMSDSALLPFAMMDADSTVIVWEATGGGMISWYECEGQPLQRYEVHEHRYTHTAPSTGESMQIALHSKDGVEAVLLEFNDLKVRYDAHAGRFEPVSTPEGTLAPTGQLLPSYSLRGKVWQDVLQIEAGTAFVTYPRLWLAKGWGVIRYESQTGMVWERLP